LPDAVLLEFGTRGRLGGARAGQKQNFGQSLRDRPEMAFRRASPGISPAFCLIKLPLVLKVFEGGGRRMAVYPG